MWWWALVGTWGRPETYVVILLRCINQIGCRGLLFKLIWRRLRRAEHFVFEPTLRLQNSGILS